MKETLPKGKYWLGDPCYLIESYGWENVCGQLAKLDWENQGGVWINWNEIKFILIGTAYGDGGYSLKINGEYVSCLGVDSGSLSIIPMPENTPLGEMENGFVVEHGGDFSAKNGDWTFGEYSVITGDDDEEE